MAIATGPSVHACGADRRSRVRSIATNCALLFASVLITLVLLEFAVRILAPQQLIVARPELYQPDDTIGWKHRANVKTILNTGDGPVHFRTDANGYRIPWNHSASEATADLRILAIGDSFLESTAVEAEATIPEILKMRLAASLNKKVAIDNAGVGGWDPNQYLMQSRRSLAKTHYDLGLVFVYIGNDLVSEAADSYPPRQVAQIHSFRLPTTLKSKDWINAVFYPVNDLLKSHSHLYLFFKTRLQVPLARLGLTAAYFPEYFALSDRNNRHWDVTAGVCDAIRLEFGARGVPVIFALLPTSYQVDPEVFDQYVKSFSIRKDAVDLDQPNRLLGARFQSASLTFLDPLAEMRQRNAQGMRLYGTVDRHLNTAGEQVLADLLFPVVRMALAAKEIHSQD